MNRTTHRWGGLVAAILLVSLGLPSDSKANTLEAAMSEIETLQEQADELRELSRKWLVGKTYDRLELGGGKALEDVVIVSLEGDEVRLRHRDGSASAKLQDGPDEWKLLVVGGSVEEDEDADEEEIPSGPVRKPGEEVSNAIVVIEGDAGVGTGFLVEKDGKTYLYTAAHVLSGNKRLAVKLRSGKKITAFGAFEASEGADLVRIEVEQEVDAALKLGASSGQAREGETIFAAGNSGGGGTVGYERGKVKGVGPESIEIDAQVIQGNSGGPILDAQSHEVLGLVTHLTDGRDDKWAKETRYSEIRRFGCRLDRVWKWKNLPIGEFLKEGQRLKEINDLNELAMIALQPDEWTSPRLRDFPNHRVVKEIRAIRDWVNERRRSATGVSEADRKKKVISLFQGIRSSSREQLRRFNPDGYVWFHREMAEHSLELREELDEACREGIDDMR